MHGWIFKGKKEKFERKLPFHFCQKEDTALPVNKVLSLIYIYGKLILKTNQAKMNCCF